MNFASVKSIICVKKKKVPRAEYFQKKIIIFLIVENFIQYEQEKTFFHEMLEGFQCNGQLGNIIDQIKTF